MNCCTREAVALPSDHTLDCLGLTCPVPMMEAARRLREMRPGEILLLIADDPATTEDMVAWCHLTGHEYLGTEANGNHTRTRVRKNGTAPGRRSVP